MIKMITACDKIATVVVLLFLLAQQSNAQDLLFPQINEPQSAQSVIEVPEIIELPEIIEFPQLEELPDDLNVLTRGPLHEAFAAAHQADPQPSALVLKAPPQVIDEVPPEYKPDGNNVQWISGYWAWDEAQSDFIWISGIWRDVPPNRQWIPGYWTTEQDGCRWVAGIWAEDSQVELGYLPQPPASIDQGPSTHAPSEDYFYVPGNWAHQNDNYRWQAGHWQPVVENWIWIPACYVWTPNGCVYQSGYWDYEFQNRGTCFAPVQFPQPVYLADNYQYRPAFTIDLSIDFLTHLFVRPGCNHYFYGDWYGANFANSGFRPWVSWSSHSRNYDPLLTYYGSRRSSFDRNYNVVQYLTRQHNFYISNRNYRPKPTYKAQQQFANNIRLSPPRGHQGFHGDLIRNSNYVRTFADVRQHDIARNAQRNHYHKVVQAELRNERRRLEQLEQLQRQRIRNELAQRNVVSRKPAVSTQQIRRAQEQVRRSQQSQREQAQRDAANRARQEQARRNQQEQARRQQEQARQTREQQAQRDRADRARQEQARRNQQEQARRTREQQAQRERADRARQEQARRAQQERTRRNEQEQDRRAAEQRAQQRDAARRDQQEQSRREQQEQDRRAAEQRAQRDAANRNRQEQARRNQQEQARREQEQSRRNQQEQARRAAEQRAQRDAANRARQEQARRNQQEQARRAQQKAQQDAARKAQQEKARRAQQDQARRAQQEKARRAQQERSRKQAAERARKQKAQREAAQRKKKR